MNTWAGILEQPVIEILGWTLLHSIWQGALVAAAFAVTRIALRRSSSNSRYLAGCAAMICLVAAPVATFITLNQSHAYRTPSAVPAAAGESHQPHTAQSTGEITFSPAPANASGRPTETRNPPTPAAIALASRLNPWLSWLVAGWIAGVFFFTIRLLFGLVYVHRLKHRGVEPFDESWQCRLENLQQRLAISRPVRLLQSSLVEVPSVIGWFRPVILVPASALTGLTPSQLESILAHELAHIRRQDYLVNLLQNVLETLLFYHPAVWWISGYVRRERENCCDDLAIEVTQEPVVYVEALASLEELRHLGPQLALRADGAGLLDRARRILGMPNGHEITRKRLAGVVALLGVALILLGLGIHAAANREPVYYGQPVSTWITMLGTNYERAASDVLTEAGEEVVPFLVKAVSAREPWHARAYHSTRNFLPDPLGERLPELRTTERNYAHIRSSSIRLLGDIAHDPELVVPVLTRAVDDIRLRSTAITALQKFQADAAPATPQLTPLLSHSEPSIRRYVALVLGSFGAAAEEAVPELAKQLTDTDDQVRIGAAEALGFIAKRPLVAVPALIETARTDYHLLRLRAIQALGEYGGDAVAAVPLIVEAFTDEGGGLQNISLEALASIGSYPSELESKIRELAATVDEDAPLKSTRANVLLWKNDPENPDLRERVVRYLRWPDNPGIRKDTAHILTRPAIPGSTASPEALLREVLDDEDPDARHNAAWHLIQFAPDAEPELSHYLKPPAPASPTEPLPPARAKIIEVIARNHFESERIVSNLLILATEPETATMVGHGLVEVLKTSALSRIDSIPEDLQPYAQKGALDAHARGSLPARHTVLAILPNLLLHQDETIRESAAMQLYLYVLPPGSDVSSTMREALKTAVSDPNERIRSQAARALARLDP